ncbi:PilZ domain-containing protein [Gellertiella hungarica]|uniref:PilZ domain-containing protein n=1 Tax=Gellertiella hungarica TaxID=1572859 RepID=A0A7W6J8A9_9HYPH|nr:PilZ domain-containing protein [Gellertiella hungarica]MBB4066645.1 hypothetical protein [Gellertiella hungarica]
MNETTPNRRVQGRVRALKGARILLNNRASALDCTIRNLSDTGAKIALSTPTNLPDEFSLRFEDGRERQCIVRWRKLSEFGVEFLTL